MEIKKVPIRDIKEYENNAKKHPVEQIEQIKRSIIEFGNCDPIALDDNNVIIEGHGRLAALKQLGFNEADVVYITHLTEQQKRAYSLIHNQLTMNTGFDPERLALELERFQNIDLGYYDLLQDGEEEPTQEDSQDGSEVHSMTLSLTESQYQMVMEASETIERTRCELHSFGNPNKRSNNIFEVIYEWAEQQKSL